jgi:hypothetical protein
MSAGLRAVWKPGHVGEGEEEQHCHGDTEQKVAQINIVRRSWNQVVQLLLILFFIILLFLFLDGLQ